MAEIDVQRRSSAGRYNWVWMIVAVALVGAFMVWLTIASEPSEVAIVENEDGEEEVDEDVPAQTVELQRFAAQPEQFTGQRVHVPNMTVQANLGRHAAWMELPTGLPYLVRFAPSLVDTGFSVRPGDRLDVTGTVRSMDESVLDTWQREGVIETDGQRMEAEFATTFLQASRASAAGAAQQGN